MQDREEIIKEHLRRMGVDDMCIEKLVPAQFEEIWETRLMRLRKAKVEGNEVVQLKPQENLLLKTG